MKPTLSSAEDLGEVFQAHQAGLVRLAAFILGDRDTREDVVQDVFVRMRERKHPMDGDLLPYLRAAVVNSQIDRQVYQIRGVVEPGNSGGPLLSPAGTVDGVVLLSVKAGVPDTGFVLTASEVRADAHAGANATVPVSTQGCAAGR